MLSQWSLEGNYIHNIFKWVKWHKAMFYSDSIRERERESSAPGSYTLVMAISWTWGPKGCLPFGTFLFNAFMVLLRLSVNASRQCSKRLVEPGSFLTCVNLERSPCDLWLPKRSGKGEFEHPDLTFKLAVKQMRRNSSFDEQSVWCYSRTRPPSTYYMLTNTM